ncbi:MAG: hypothetical protein UDN39_01470 [Christensenellales bacterium]|nr:hypothetical protein [Christensenellales bacterium]
MKCINFDRAFERYMAEWIKENSEKYKDDMDVIEDMMPDVYLEFLKKPADFLDGVAPQDYFEQFDNADMLVNWLCDYIAQGVPVPDLLLERVTALGNPAEKSLLALVARDDLPEETQMMAISLLREMESKAPMQRYIDYIASLEEPSDKGDLCAEALMSMGESVVEPILATLSGAGQTGRDIFADVLSNYPGDERIYELMIERFVTRDERRALFASYLAKLGDERAIPMLKEAAQSPDINYLDYVEVVNAIEALGGERPPEREFSGDPYYESLRQV